MLRPFTVLCNNYPIQGNNVSATSRQMLGFILKSDSKKYSVLDKSYILWFRWCYMHQGLKKFLS